MLDIYVHEYLRTFVFKQVTYFIRHSGGIKVWKIYLIRWTMLLRPLDFSTYRRAIFNSPEVKKKKIGNSKVHHSNVHTRLKATTFFINPILTSIQWNWETKKKTKKERERERIWKLSHSFGGEAFRKPKWISNCNRFRSIITTESNSGPLFVNKHKNMISSRLLPLLSSHKQ